MVVVKVSIRDQKEMKINAVRWYTFQSFPVMNFFDGHDNRNKIISENMFWIEAPNHLRPLKAIKDNTFFKT